MTIQKIKEYDKRNVDSVKNHPFSAYTKSSENFFTAIIKD